MVININNTINNNINNILNNTFNNTISNTFNHTINNTFNNLSVTVKTLFRVICRKGVIIISCSVFFKYGA